MKIIETDTNTTMSISQPLPIFSRPLGDSELSYFLPSRSEGVNDMYLHLSLHTSPHLITPRRLALVWGIMMVRHPLLAARVDMEEGYGARFVYSPPSNAQMALLTAHHTLFLRQAPPKALIDDYLNGPRTLSNERLAVLIVSSPSFAVEVDGNGRMATGAVTPPATPGTVSGDFNFTPATSALCHSQTDELPTPQPQGFDLLLCAVHFLGDGIALHTSANEMFMLLAGHASSHTHNVPSPASNGSHAQENGVEGEGTEDANTPLSDEALQRLLEYEWFVRWGAASPYSAGGASPLPPSLESRLAVSLQPPSSSDTTAGLNSISRPHSDSESLRTASSLHTFQRVARDLAFRRAQDRLVGGHGFARVPSPGVASITSILSNPTSIPAANRKSVRTHHSLLRTYAFPPALTAHILARCKRHGVSVSNVLFGGCAVGWQRVGGVRGDHDTKQGNTGIEERRKWEQLPVMMYSALNLRPHLVPSPDPIASYWFLAVGYFNVVLPVFELPGDGDAISPNGKKTATTKTLLHRSRLAKQQTAMAAKHPLLRPYALRMARERGERAKAWAVIDDAAERVEPDKGRQGGVEASKEEASTLASKSLNLLPPSPPATPPTTPVGTRASTPPLPQQQGGSDLLSSQEPEPSKETNLSPPLDSASAPPASSPTSSTSSVPSSTASGSASAASTAPSKALIGLSLLGNLDGIYNHDAYTNLSLHTLTTGSRQRSGSALLFGYTFKGRLWVSLGWDGGTFGGEGDRGRGVVWEGVEGTSVDAMRGNDVEHETMGKGARGSEDMDGMSIVGPEGEMGRWWREVVGVLGEVFGEGEGCA